MQVDQLTRNCDRHSKRNVKDLSKCSFPQQSNSTLHVLVSSRLVLVSVW